MRRSVIVLVALASVGGCARRPTPADLAYATPPVRAATPAGLLSAGATAQALALEAPNFRNRFFSPGPTDVFGLLRIIDDRIASVNDLTSRDVKDCVTQAPVPFDLQVFGETVTLWAQCYYTIQYPVPDPTEFVQFGKKDGVTYLYYTLGESRGAAIVSPIDGAPGEYTVRAWFGVGYLAGPSGGSYGGMALRADSRAKAFELAVAGINIGYCGAQLASDGTRVYAVGSEWDGCLATSTLCVAATDVTTPSTCDAPLTTFTLPPMGRTAANGPEYYWPASDYPGGAGNTIVLDGTTGDSLHFGPTEPTPGVGRF